MKQPIPQDVARAAEAALVSALTLNASATLAAARGLCDPEDIDNVFLRAVWRAALELAERADPIGPVTLAAEAVRAGNLPAARAHAIVCEALAGEGLPAMASAYARRVRRESARRALLIGATTMFRRARSGEDEPEESAAALRGLAEDADRAVTPVETAANAGELLGDVIASSAEAFEGRGRVLDPFVHPLVNGVLPWLRDGHLLIVGGKAKSGKSHLCRALAYAWARAGHAGTVLTAEDAPSLWSLREACAELELQSDQVQRGKLTPTQWTALRAERERHEALPLRIEYEADAGRIALAIRAAGRARQRFVVVDHLQRLHLRGGPRETQERTREIVRLIARAATEAAIPVVLVSQLRRGEDEWARPHAGLLWGSGAIEQDAHAVVLLWRYRRKDYGRVRVILDLWRHGSPAETDVTWMPHSRRFSLASEPTAAEETPF